MNVQKLAVGAMVATLWFAHVKTVSASPSNGPKTLAQNDLIAFTNPSPASTTAGSAVKVTLRLSRDADPETLKITDNGIDVTDAFRVKNHCAHAPCVVPGVLRKPAQVQPGWNYLLAKVTTPTGAASSARVRFYSRQGLTDPTNPVGLPAYSVHVAMSPTAGIEVDYTAENGEGQHFYPGDHPCTGAIGGFTVINLDRTTLAWKNSICFNPGDDATLQSFLSTLTEQDLILASTGPGAPLGAMNLAPIGGTDFKQGNTPFAYSYSIIGYGRATPGIASESYNTSSAGAWHGLTGDLINMNGNQPIYGFRSTDPVGFAITPNGIAASITIGNVTNLPTGTATPPNQNIPAGFSSVTYNAGAIDEGGVWILVLDRYTLAEVSSNTYTVNDEFQSMNIYNALSGLDNSKIFFLTTIGTGPGSLFSQGLNYGDLLNFLLRSGVSPYAVGRISGSRTYAPYAAFSMVGVPNNFQPQGTSCDNWANNTTTSCTPNQDQWFSSIADQQQGENGALKGSLARNRAFLYTPKNVQPFNPSDLGPNPSADDLLADSLSEAVGSAPHVAWPLQDTPGHLNAYKYLSNLIISHDFYGGGTCLASPSYVCQDVRFYYTGDELSQIANGIDPASIPYPGDAIAQQNQFSAADWTDATTQLSLEKAYLGDAHNYEVKLESVNTASSLNIAGQLQAAASQVANDLNQATGISLPGTKQSPLALTADVVGTVGSAIGAASVICPPCGVVGGVMGAVSGILNIAKDAQKGAAPMPNPYVNQLGDLMAQEDGTASKAAANFNGDIQTSTGTFFNGIYSDWFKLQTVALMAVNPSASAWYFTDDGDTGIQQVTGKRFLATMRKNFYLQTANQYFESIYLVDVPQSLVTDSYTITQLSSDMAKREGLNYNSLAVYSWDNRYAPATFDSDWNFNWVVLKNNTKATWSNEFGNALMGVPNADDGSGNLNLNRDVLYDSGIFPVWKYNSY